MKLNLNVLFVAFCFSSFFSYAQTLESSFTFGGDYNDIVQDLEKGSNGDIFVVGNATNATDFNPNGLPSVISVPPAPATNAFIAKYNSSMVLEWMVSFKGEASHIILDDSLNVYAMGYGVGTVDFNPSSEIDTLDWEGNGQFLVKYGNDGAFKGVTELEGEYLNYGGAYGGKGVERLFQDDFGYIYSYLGPKVFKYNSNLDLVWEGDIGRFPQLTLGNSMASLGVNQLAQGTILNELEIENYSLNSGELTDSTICATTDGGLLINSLNVTGNNELLIYGSYWGILEVFDNEDTLVFENVENLNSGGGNPYPHDFVCKYDSLHNLIWFKTFDGNGPNPEIIKEDDNGHFYVLGHMGDTVNFSPDNPVYIVSEYIYATYIAKYDENFNYLSMSQVYGDHSYIGDFKQIEDTVYITGSYFYSMDIDMSSSEEFVEEPIAQYDAFIACYSEFNITENELSITEEDISSNPLSLFVNELTGTLNVCLDENVFKDEEYKLNIYDMTGRLINSIPVMHSSIQINIEGFKESAYILQTKSKTQSFSKIWLKP